MNKQPTAPPAPIELEQVNVTQPPASAAMVGVQPIFMDFDRFQPIPENYTRLFFFSDELFRGN